MDIKIIPAVYNVPIPDTVGPFIKLPDGSYQILDKRRPLRIERRSYDEDIWCIHDGFGCMNRKLEFDFESLPSNRKEEWLKEHRFTFKDAKKLVRQLFEVWERNSVEEDPRK